MANTFTTGQTLTAAQMNAIGQDYATDTTSYTAATGWSVTTFEIHQVGKVVHFVCGVSRTGSAITVPADGNVGNSDLLTITNAAARPRGQATCSTTHTGPQSSFYVRTDGVVQLTATVPGASLATGTNLSFSGVWLVP